MIIFMKQIYIKQLDLFFVLLSIDINKLLKVNRFGEMAESPHSGVKVVHPALREMRRS
jgi:hypothetical protein